jgi:hypothetical protein
MSLRLNLGLGLGLRLGLGLVISNLEFLQFLNLSLDLRWRSTWGRVRPDLTILLSRNFNCGTVPWGRLVRWCWILDFHSRRRHKSIVQPEEVIRTGLTIGRRRSRDRDWRWQCRNGIESINEPVTLLFRLEECGGRRRRVDREEENSEARGGSGGVGRTIEMEAIKFEHHVFEILIVGDRDERIKILAWELILDANLV